MERDINNQLRAQVCVVGLVFICFLLESTSTVAVPWDLQEKEGAFTFELLVQKLEARTDYFYKWQHPLFVADAGCPYIPQI